MLRRTLTTLILSLLLIAYLAMTAFAAKSPVKKKRVQNLKVDRSIMFSFPDENNFTPGVSSSEFSLGSTNYDKDPGHPSAGVKIGDTWYDYQSNGRIPRMIDWGSHSGTPDTVAVHFSWMQLPSPLFASRKYFYNYYNGAKGSLAASPVGLQPDDEYAGYVGIDVMPSNQAVVGGHNNPGSGYQSQIYFDFAPLNSFFNTNARVPDSLAAYYQQAGFGDECIWPTFRLQFGTDTVLHIFAQISEAGAGDPQAAYYFRKVGYHATGTWDNPPYCVDTIYDISQDVAAERTGNKVALVWTANLPNAGDCDTCSGESDVAVQWDNDIYYQISLDQGANWEPRVNLTMNVNGEAGFRPYTDLSSLIDAAGNLHIIWPGVVWPADPVADGWGWNCRLFHWSENVPQIRTVASADWSQTICTPGAWNVNIAKMSVSECDGKIYSMWVQFNDIPGGIEDDCAARAEGGTGDVQGSANGDLWVSISNDGGLTWDAARNLTHSYSGGCDPANGLGDCYSDNWPSMARYGRQNLAGDDWSGAVVVVPGDVAWNGDYYLDVQYIDDRDAGGIVQDEGTWQLANVNWFRMACVNPVEASAFIPSWTDIDFPAWGKPSIQVDTQLVVENTGNITLTYAITAEEDNGTAGWLAYTGASGSIPSGQNNTETITVELNSGGNEAGPIELVGRLIFTGNAPTSPDTLSINFLVVDTVINPSFEVISTGCIALAVGSNGNLGREGVGRFNMDWVDAGDCDTLADVYLYDGSPVIGWIAGSDTVFNWSIFGDGYLDSLGFVPVAPGAKNCNLDPDFDIYQTDVFTTHDTTIALQKVFIAPKDVDSCDFIIQKLSVWSYDGLAHNGLVIGEAIDWDIPSDSGSENTGGIDATTSLIYQVGIEYGQDDTTECQESDARFGGIAFVESFLNGSLQNTVPYGGYTAENDSFVYPASGFVSSELYENMSQSGLLKSDSLEDLHSVMTYEPSFNLGASDVYEVYVVLATVQNGAKPDLIATVNKAKAWFNARNWTVLLEDTDGDHVIDACASCCALRGNIDGFGGIDIADLVYFVDFSFSQPPGPPPPCDDGGGYYPEADVDNSGGVDIGDIVYMVDFMFSQPPGPAPVPCN